MARRIAAFTLAAGIGAVALLGLAGCTGAPSVSSTPDSGSSAQTESRDGSSPAPQSDGEGDGGQSKADACALVQDTITQATSNFGESSAEDPAAVVEAMTAAAAELASAAPQITNDEVAAVVPALQQMFAQAAEVMGAVASGDAAKMEDLSALGEEFQETSEAFQEICTP